MTEEDLQVIREAFASAVHNCSEYPEVAQYVPALLAEVQRLLELIDDLHADHA